MISNLDKTYRDAIYQVWWKENWISFKPNHFSAEIDKILASHGATSFAFITAYNPLSIQLSSTENRQYQNELERVLQLDQFEFLLGESTNEDHSWESEVSLFVLGISKVRAIEIATAFSQNAFIYGEFAKQTELIWCRK